ncbi:MAG: hypothetical protein WD749_07430 [Phycisphaerales bacterium]
MERAPEADPFRPPKASCRVFCMHCQEKYDSYRIEWREFQSKDGTREGFWCCPTPGCGGKGFLFDIYPTDPNWEDEENRGMSGGWYDDDGNPAAAPFADIPW